MTVEEIKESYDELNEIWDNGNHDSLHFCRYVKQAIEELTDNCYYNFDVDELPEGLEDNIDFLESEVYNHWRLCKIAAGETKGMLQIPVGV